MKNLLSMITTTVCFCIFENCFALSELARSKEFVYLSEVDSSIPISIRDCSTENFIGKQVDGYKKPVCILTRKAAEALRQVQREAKKNGYSLVIYDAYRPQQAVNHYIAWSKDLTDQIKKSSYYPRVDKDKIFELGYVSKRSSHSRGSTIDLTLIKYGKALYLVKEKGRALSDGFTFKFLDDGTLDMGSHFDLLDKASHTDSTLVKDKYRKRRMYLKKIMEKHGFKNYPKEWWHFRLAKEPYSADQESSYFNFPIE